MSDCGTGVRTMLHVLNQRVLDQHQPVETAREDGAEACPTCRTVWPCVVWTRTKARMADRDTPVSG